MPRQAEDGRDTEGEDSDEAEDRELLQRAMSIAWVPPSKDLANFAYVRQHYHHEVRRPSAGPASTFWVILFNCASHPEGFDVIWVMVEHFFDISMSSADHVTTRGEC